MDCVLSGYCKYNNTVIIITILLLLLLTLVSYKFWLSAEYT